MPKVRQECDESAQFIESFKSGDPKAFDVFCKLYKTVVTNSIRGKCRPSELEDLTQDVFLKIFKVKYKYDPTKSKLTTWTSRIAKSVAIDKYRYGRKRRADSLDSDLELKSDKITPSIDFSVKLFKGLSQEDIQILRLKYSEGLKFRQVAISLEIPVGSVKSRTNRSILKIRENIQNA